MQAVRYIIKTPNGYVTGHARGRMTKHIESARTFKTWRGVNANKYASGAEILRVKIEIDVLT